MLASPTIQQQLNQTIIQKAISKCLVTEQLAGRIQIDCLTIMVLKFFEKWF